MRNTSLLTIEQEPRNNNDDNLTIYVDLPVPVDDAPLSFFDVFKKISALALTMGLSFTFCFEVFLTVFLLQFLSESEDETAAATLVATWMSTVCILLMSPLFAVNIDLSGKLGAWRVAERLRHEIEESTPELIQSLNFQNTREQEKEKIESTNINSLLIAAIATVPAASLLYYAKPILVSVFGQSESIALVAQSFLRIFVIAVPGLFTRIALEPILFSLGKTTQAMLMALSSFFVGGSLSVLLSFNANSDSLISYEQGIALGLVAEAYLTAISYGLFIKFNTECQEFDFFKVSIERIRRNLSGLKEILRLGGSITFTVAIELALTLSAGIFSGLLGVEQQAAMSYCTQLIYFEFIFTAAFGFSCTQEIRRELKAGRFTDAEKIGKYGLLTTLIYLTPLPVIFAAYPKALEYISGGVSETVATTLTTLVPIVSAGVVLNSVYYNLLQQTRALNDLLIPNIIAFIGLSSGIGLSAGLGLETVLDVNGVGAGYTIGIGLTAGALFLRQWNNMKKMVREDNLSLEDSSALECHSRNCRFSFFYCFRNRTITQVDLDCEELNETHPLLINA